MFVSDHKGKGHGDHHGGHKGHGKGDSSNGMLLNPQGEGINLSASGTFTGQPMNEMQAKAYEK